MDLVKDWPTKLPGSWPDNAISLMQSIPSRKDHFISPKSYSVMSSLLSTDYSCSSLYLQALKPEHHTWLSTSFPPPAEVSCFQQWPPVTLAPAIPWVQLSRKGGRNRECHRWTTVWEMNNQMDFVVWFFFRFCVNANVNKKPFHKCNMTHLDVVGKLQERCLHVSYMYF